VHCAGRRSDCVIDDLTAFRRARAEFERRRDKVTVAQHTLPTPCAEWDVITLIRHVIDGDTFATLLLEGASLGDAFTALVGMDNSREFAHEANVLDAAFAAAARDQTVDHPVGPTSVGDFLDFRTTDYAAHAWDLARATGQDETLDSELIELLWERSERRLDSFVSSAEFDGGPSDAGSEGAGQLQSRWLDRIGRRP